jgi:predicted transcriptional regulator
LPIQIIAATPGPTTEETIVDLIITHPQGLTVKQLSQRLNRPVSMIQLCLKSLIANKKISVRLNNNGMQKIYYPCALEMWN